MGTRVEKLQVEMRAQMLTVKRSSVAVIDNVGGELKLVDNEDLCRLEVSRGKQHAEVVWFSDGHVESLFVLCDDPIFREAIGDTYTGAFFGDD